MYFPKLLPVFLTIVSLVLVSDFQVAKADHGGFHALPGIIEKPPKTHSLKQSLAMLVRLIIKDALRVTPAGTLKGLINE